MPHIAHRDDLRAKFRLYNPYIIRKGVEHLFQDDTIYKKIFSNRPVKEYIANYWLHKLIKNESNAERTYCIWYVMNDVYQSVKTIMKERRKRDAFIYVCERKSKSEYTKILQPLKRLINAQFDFYVKDFFRYSKRQSKGPVDPSSFFNNQKILLNFEKFYKTQLNQKKKILVERQQSNFIRAIQHFEYPE